MAQAQFAQAKTTLQTLSAALFGTGRGKADAPPFVDDAAYITRGNPAHPEHDRLGFRNVALPRRPRLAVVGDSQTYGTHVARGESWPAQAARMLKADVYSAAVPGWGSLQYALTMDDILRQRPKTVLVCPYLGNDIYEAYVHARISTAPLAKSLLQGIDTTAPPPDGSIHFGMQDTLARRRRETPDLDEHQLLALCAERDEPNIHRTRIDKAEFYLTEHSRTPFEDLDQPAVAAGFTITMRALAYARDAARSAGAAFGVMPIPTREYLVWLRRGDAELQRPELLDRHGAVESRLLDALQAACRDKSIRFFDPAPELRRFVGSGMYYQHSLDGHPSPLGTRLLANFAAHRVLPDLHSTAGAALYPLY